MHEENKSCTTLKKKNPAPQIWDHKSVHNVKKEIQSVTLVVTDFEKTKLTSSNYTNDLK